MYLWKGIRSATPLCGSDPLRSSQTVLTLPGVIQTPMSKSSVRLRGHLAVIVSQCDMLEDVFSARNEIMLRINVIRNAAHRITKAIDLQSWSSSEVIVEDRPDGKVRRES